MFLVSTLSRVFFHYHSLFDTRVWTNNYTHDILWDTEHQRRFSNCGWSYAMDEQSHRTETHVYNYLSMSYSCMMTSSNGSIFRVTGPLCGEFTGLRWIPRTKASDVELWCYFDLRPNKRLSKQSWGWWFETLSCPLWRHRNGLSHLEKAPFPFPLLAFAILVFCVISCHIGAH